MSASPIVANLQGKVAQCITHHQLAIISRQSAVVGRQSLVANSKSLCVSRPTDSMNFMELIRIVQLVLVNYLVYNKRKGAIK